MDIRNEILEILIKNGYCAGDVTGDTFLYENNRGENVVIERPDETGKIEDTNQFRPHSAYVVNQFFDNDVQLCNSLLEELH